MGVHCEGVSGATAKPPTRARRRDSPCNDENQAAWVCTAKGCRGRPQTSSVFIAPDSRPQARNPLLTEKTSYDWKSYNSVAPIWRDTAQLVE